MNHEARNHWQEMVASLSLLLLLFVTALPVSGTSKQAERAATRIAAAPKHGSEPIKIGYIIPLSGQAAEPGHKIVNGMQLYLDQIHHKMGGRDVNVIVESDDSSPATGFAKLNKLVKEDKVDLLSGMLLSNILYGIAPVVESYRVPFVVVSAGADDITQRKRKKWFVRACYTSSQPAHPMGDYAAKKLGYKRVITVCSDYPYGWEVAGGFQQCFEEAGGKVVQKLWAPLGFKDFSELIKQIRKDADAIFLCSVGQSSEIIPVQIRQAGITLPFIGTTGSFDESFYPRIKDELNNAVSASLYSTALDTAANKEFVKRYKARYGESPSYFSEHGYTAMMWIDKAIESLHGDVSDKEKVLAALKAVEIKNAPRGPVSLDAYGSSIDNVYIRKTEHVKGKLQNTVIFTYPNVSEFWKYNPEEYLKQPSYSKEYPPCKYCR